MTKEIEALGAENAQLKEELAYRVKECKMLNEKIDVFERIIKAVQDLVC